MKHRYCEYWFESSADTAVEWLTSRGHNAIKEQVEDRWVVFTEHSTATQQGEM